MTNGKFNVLTFITFLMLAGVTALLLIILSAQRQVVKKVEDFQEETRQTLTGAVATVTRIDQNVASQVATSTKTIGENTQATQTAAKATNEVREHVETLANKPSVVIEKHTTEIVTQSEKEARARARYDSDRKLWLEKMRQYRKGILQPKQD